MGKKATDKKEEKLSKAWKAAQETQGTLVILDPDYFK